MTRIFIALPLFILSSIMLVAQDKTIITPVKPKTKKAYRPDIPGNFVLDLGINRSRQVPENWTQALWGSRTLNLYYQYPIRIQKSKFTVNPGLGFAFERFKLKGGWSMNPQPNPDGSYSLELASQTPELGGDFGASIRKTMIVANYFDIPLDVRFDTNPEDKARSFNVSLGGRFGLLYDAFTKIKYRYNGETMVLKDKQDHGLNPFHYGLYTRFGTGSFALFMFWNLSPYFATSKGPTDTNGNYTKMNTLTFGFSVNGF
jgi:hypothetical protein